MTKEAQEASTRAQNLIAISNKLRQGVTVEEYEGLKDLPVAMGWTVKDLLKANLQCGYIKYKEGKFTTIQATIKVSLTPDEENSLNQKAAKEGLEPNELAERYILNGLSNN